MAGAEAMAKDSEEVTNETLQDLSGNLFKEWRDVGRNLKLAETELDNIEADNRRKGQKQVVYHMLLLWKLKRGMKATNKTLRDALKAAKRKDLSDYLLNREQCGTTLGWEKFDIGDEIVEGKRIVLYAAKEMSSSNSIIYIHVGFYLDLPGCEKIVSINEVSILVKQSAVFLKKGKLPLTCHFVNIEPPDWTCGAEEKNPKEISFKRVATSRGGFCTFVLNIKEGIQERHNCKCHFEAGQGADLVELRFILKDGGEDSAASSSNKLVDAGLSQSQKRTGDESLTVKQPIENIDLEVRTESLRDLPREIQNEWINVGRKLGLDDSKLYNLEREYTNYGHKETVYRMLLTWKYSNGSQATYRVLGEALIAAGRRDLQEALYKQEETYKTVEQQEDKGIDVPSQGKASILTFSDLKKELSLRLTKTDCGDLSRYFALPPPDQVQTIITSPLYSENFLLALEEKGYIHPSNVNRLTDALTELKINGAHLLTKGYMKLIDPETEYDRFLGSLSAHLTISITEKLCENFKLTDGNKNTVSSSQNPGLSFLLTIDDMGIINPSDVSKLKSPLEDYHLVQAVAKIHEYQSLVLSDETMPRDEDKENFFIKCLQQKIKSWFETMTPVPWKKSCQWKSNDLYIASRLVLTTSGSKISSREVDQKCKLHYRGIFTDERLKAETRIILEGQPGSGKTMLSSQLAYDWCCGKLMDIPMVIYLPLKIVDNMTIIQAIKMFYIRKGIPITEEDIESILNSGKKKVCLILDGLEEYNGVTKDGSPSEVMRVMTKEKLSNCIVIITARTDYAKHLPPGPMLKIGSFGEDERNEYIKKVFSDDVKRQEEVKELIDSVPFILDLCNVPLLFVLLVHNIDRLGKFQERQLDRVTPFVKAIVDILCPVQDEEDKRSHLSDQKTNITLEELAFNGLCKGNQQLFWQKDFVDRSVTNSKAWIDSGILVVEEGTPFHSPDRNLQTDSGNGTPQTDSISDESLNTSNVTSEIKRGVSPDPDLSASVSQSESKPILESKEKKSIPLQKGKVAKYISLQVKFLHKLIQECFAAEYLARLFWGHKSTEQHYNYQLFREHLANIDPADLHYVLRFTCHICPPSFHLIASFLIRDFQTGDFEIPDYIINCICLCFAEYDGYKGHKVKDIVKEVCRRESVNFSSGDSQLLLRSKVSMLTFASRSQIPIECLKLSDVVKKITEKALILKADVSLGVLNTLRAIEVSRWDQKPIEQDYEDLIKFIINNEKVKVARFLFPSPPVAVKDEKVLNNLQSRNISVEWIIGNFIFTLNVTTGEWMMEFRLPGRMAATSPSLKPISDETNKTVEQQEDEINDVPSKGKMEFRLRSRNSNEPSATKAVKDIDLDTSLSIQSLVNKEGGILEIPGTCVRLEIPFGAIEQECLIQMRIIPISFEEESKSSFTSNSTVVVELLPDNLRLHQLAKLTLPHCLQLKKIGERKAMVYSSHHAKGSKPTWRPKPYVSYQLNDTNCVIWIESFSWETLQIDEKCVEFKKIQVYAARDLDPPPEIIPIYVGFYPKLPGERPNELLILKEIPFQFLKAGNMPLQILFKEVKPMSWKYTGEEKCRLQTIPFMNIAANVDCPRSFVFEKVGEEVCLLFFGATQEDQRDPVDLIFQFKNPSVPSHETIRGEAEGNPAGAEAMGKDSEVVKDSTLMDLSGKLSKGWEDVGRNLKLKDTKLENIEADNNKKGQKQVVYQMLLLWKRQYGVKATNKTLRYALQAAERTDLSDYLLIRERCGTTSVEGTVIE